MGEWAASTLDNVAALGAEVLVGGRGAVARGRVEVEAAIAQSRHFLDELRRTVGTVHSRGGTLLEAFRAAHDALAPRFGGWPIFEHCLPPRTKPNLRPSPGPTLPPDPKRPHGRPLRVKASFPP